MATENSYSKSTLFGYTPNNFFWQNIKYTNTTPDECVNVSTINCSTITTKNLDKCYTQQICKNKENYEWIQNVETTHSGADERFIDTENQYNRELQKSFNLGIGVIGILFLIYSTKS